MTEEPSIMKKVAAVIAIWVIITALILLFLNENYDFSKQNVLLTLLEVGLFIFFYITSSWIKDEWEIWKNVKKDHEIRRLQNEISRLQKMKQEAEEKDTKKTYEKIIKATELKIARLKE